MKILLRNFLILILSSLSIIAFANPCDDGGIGGTGIALNRGIGGTGDVAEEDIARTGITNIQKGIGGTGIQANSGIGGTGIVGVITGFGSICVNGLEVLYFTDTPVELDGKKISSEDLSIGQVVAVRASDNGKTILANEIHAYHQITGPITEIKLQKNTLKVMGETVIADSLQINGLHTGQWVNVSGVQKDDGSVYATRIDPTDSQKYVQVIGSLVRKGNQYSLNNTKIEGIPTQTDSINSDMRVNGQWNGKKIIIKNMTIGPVSELLQKVDTFNIQGIASNEAATGQLTLYSQKISIFNKTQIINKNTNGKLTGKPIIVRGQMRNGKPTALFIEIQRKNIEMHHLNESKVNHINSKFTNESNESNEKASSKVNDSNSLSRAKLFNETHSSKEFDNSIKYDNRESLNKIDRIEKIDKIDRIEKIDKIDRIEKVDKVDRIEKVERAETY